MALLRNCRNPLDADGENPIRLMRPMGHRIRGDDYHEEVIGELIAECLSDNRNDWGMNHGLNQTFNCSFVRAGMRGRAGISVP